jgi:predicted ester cyclase
LSIEENKELIKRYVKENIDALGDADKSNTLIDKYLTPDAVVHIAGGTDMNIEQWKGVAGYMYNAFSDINITIDDMVAEGDKVVVRSTWEATQTGEYLGVAPTGKKTAIDIVTLYRIAGGKISGTWMLTDAFSLMIQLGAIPNPYVQR